MIAVKGPFEGEELVRILIEPYEIHFAFSDTVLQARYELLGRERP
jgi:hypothetical protein